MVDEEKDLIADNLALIDEVDGLKQDLEDSHRERSLLAARLVSMQNTLHYMRTRIPRLRGAATLEEAQSIYDQESTIPGGQEWTEGGEIHKP